jgi:hypothetical protein
MTGVVMGNDAYDEIMDRQGTVLIEEAGRSSSAALFWIAITGGRICSISSFFFFFSCIGGNGRFDRCVAFPLFVVR